MGHKESDKILGTLYTECPACDSTIQFSKYKGIKVNCESEQKENIPKMYNLTESCNNPFCKWSKVEIE